MTKLREHRQIERIQFRLPADFPRLDQVTKTHGHVKHSPQDDIRCLHTVSTAQHRPLPNTPTCRTIKASGRPFPMAASPATGLAPPCRIPENSTVCSRWTWSS